MDVEQRARELLAAEYGDDPMMQKKIMAGTCRNEELMRAERALIAALTPPGSWVAAADRELVAAEIGVAKVDDPTDVAAAKLRELIDWHVNVATDPAVNGGYVLVPVEPTEVMLEAGGDVEQIHIEWGVDPYVENTADVWRAMLAARPEVPDGRG